MVRDFEQLTMSGSRATGALSMGTSAGYISILKLVKFNLFLKDRKHRPEGVNGSLKFLSKL